MMESLQNQTPPRHAPMDSTTLENRYIVRSVRGTLRDKMRKIKPGAPPCGLRELSSRYSLFTPSGCSIRLEHAPTRAKVGWLVGEAGHPDDPLVNYGLVQLANGETFEFAQEHHPELEVSTFPPQAALGVTTIRHNGAVIGECRATGLGTTLGTRYENAWDLTLNEKPFGRVAWPAWDSWEELRILRPDGSPLPLSVPRHDPLLEWLSLLLMLFDSFAALFNAAGSTLLRRFPFAGRWAHRALIIPPGAGINLDEQELAFYFAVTLLFRVYVGMKECRRGHV